MINPSAEIASVAGVRNAASWAELPEAELLEGVQRRTFGFFWQGADALGGLAPDRCTTYADELEGPATIGGTGFGIMALIVAVERGWITRPAAVERLARILAVLTRATRYHGAFPHFLNPRTGATIPFGPLDDGGDLVETSFLCMGLLCARQYFDRDCPSEGAVRAQATLLWEEVDWNWYTQGGQAMLYWHWSPIHGWAMQHAILGWNECLVTYLLAVSAPRHATDPSVYHQGFASGEGFYNHHRYYGIELPLGMPYGGPLFFTHYSFCGLDPRGLRDRYADYWQQNLRHVRINRAHCIANPYGYKGYGNCCWGLSASDGPDGYVAHAPDLDSGTIAPTAALASLPYAPREVLNTLRYFLTHYGDRLWGRYGFVDAFCEQRDWYGETYIAIDQGPIIVLIENYRTGLLWRLFMSVPEVQAGLRRLEFTSPYLSEPIAE
jgi:hypothetical protein